MRWTLCLGLMLSLAACESETSYINPIVAPSPKTIVECPENGQGKTGDGTTLNGAEPDPVKDGGMGGTGHSPDPCGEATRE